MLFCSLCFKTREDPNDRDFYKVPKDKRTRKKWGTICRIDFKKKTAWICKDHFLPSDIRKTGGQWVLAKNAVPFIAPVKEPAKIIEASYKKSDLKSLQQSECIDEKLMEYDINSNSVNVPQMQENFVMEIPVQKTVFCTRPTQTNTRLCGLVQTSEFADDFRFNCFYCCDIFPLENWKDFTIHLKKKHFDKEKAFETSEYTSAEHDYAPINLPSISSVQPVHETIGISPESLLPFLGNEEEPTIPINPFLLYTENGNMAVPENILKNLLMDDGDPLNVTTQEHGHNQLQSMGFNPAICSVQDDNAELSVNFDILNRTKAGKTKKLSQKSAQSSKNFKNKSSKQKIFNVNQSRNASKLAPRKTILSRFLKRTIKEETDLDEKATAEDAVEDCSGLSEIKQETTPVVISYEFSPNAIVDLLIDTMKNYPILWQFNTEPFNDLFARAILELCKILNDNWSLNINQLTMRRSVNRVLRFYCYLFPNENIENIHPFTCYYDKCAEFLPASVNEIAYARCSHCYICFHNDFDLKRHLLKEQSFNLKWPYKCVECKECFEENDDYEFHKRLPHYIEVFRCEPCKKKYFRRNIFNKHNSDYHPKENADLRKFKCDQCEKTYRTLNCLRAHQVYHGEKKFKCHLCSKQYHENAKLQVHLKTHRKQYDFICEVCAKEFVTQSALNVHMKKHTGEKVTCSICNLKLRKSSLSRHLRLLHKPPADGIVKAKNIRGPYGKYTSYKRLVRKKPFQRRKESEQRKYRCKLCMISFDKYKPLAEHNKEMHSDLPKWPCQLCSTMFGLKLNLKRHYRRKHKLHVIQVYKLVEEGDDLNEVLSIKTEHLDILAETGAPPNHSETKSNVQIDEIKSEFLSEENAFEDDNMETFSIEEEIMEATDNITKDEMKIDYMNDFFTEILK